MGALKFKVDKELAKPVPDVELIKSNYNKLRILGAVFIPLAVLSVGFIGWAVWKARSKESVDAAAAAAAERERQRLMLASY